MLRNAERAQTMLFTATFETHSKEVVSTRPAALQGTFLLLVELFLLSWRRIYIRTFVVPSVTFMICLGAWIFTDDKSQLTLLEMFIFGAVAVVGVYFEFTRGISAKIHEVSTNIKIRMELDEELRKEVYRLTKHIPDLGKFIN